MSCGHSTRSGSRAIGHTAWAWRHSLCQFNPLTLSLLSGKRLSLSSPLFLFFPIFFSFLQPQLNDSRELCGRRVPTRVPWLSFYVHHVMAYAINSEVIDLVSCFIRSLKKSSLLVHTCSVDRSVAWVGFFSSGILTILSVVIILWLLSKQFYHTVDFGKF